MKLHFLFILLNQSLRFEENPLPGTGLSYNMTHADHTQLSVSIATCLFHYAFLLSYLRQQQQQQYSLAHT